jgi:hypothetical protein
MAVLSPEVRLKLALSVNERVTAVQTAFSMSDSCVANSGFVGIALTLVCVALVEIAASILANAPQASTEYQSITGVMGDVGVKVPSFNITINNAGSVVSDADLVALLRNGRLTSNLSVSPSAVGRLLEEDEYSEIFENSGVVELNDCGKLGEVVYNRLSETYGIRFLNEIQELHDRDHNWESDGLSEIGKRKVEEIKTIFNLN